VSPRSPIASDVSTPLVTPIRERFRREVAGAIAAAAEEVFAEKGLHSAHVDQIAKRAGVAVGTLYNHYADRDALLAALLRDRGDELVATLNGAIASGEGQSLRTQLYAFVEAYFFFFVAHRPYFKMLLEGELAQLQSTYPRSAVIPVRCHQTILQQLEGLFHRAIDTQQLRADRADLYPWLLLGMMRSVAVRDLRKYKAYKAADGAEIVNVFLGGAGA
jgi:AcrR family transcriptional regulator